MTIVATMSACVFEGKDLVLVGDDFARHPTSFEHLMRRFMDRNRVIWVETIGMRRPRLSVYDIKRAIGKIRRVFLQPKGPPNPELRPAGLSVISPLMIPFHDLKWVRNFNEWNLARAIRRELGRRGIRDFGHLTTVPLAAGLAARIGARFTVYYCMDDWKNWPGLLGDCIPEWEKRLVAESDLIVATSEELARTMRATSKPSVFLPHGVDVEHFARASRPGPWTPARRLTYFGLLDERTDQVMLKAVADSRADATIEIIGPVQADISMLRSIPNVRFRGAVPYRELPEALKEADVLLLPYRLDTLAKSINPLKIRECLATGKPVVAMALQEVGSLPGLLVAQTPEHFVALCQDLIDGKLTPRSENLAPLLSDSSWERRAEVLSKYLVPLFEASALTPQATIPAGSA